MPVTRKKPAKAAVRRQAKVERLEARISPEQKQLFERAADLQGRSLTEFVVRSTQEAAQEAIRDHNLNRVVVAGCSHRTHESLFQRTVREAGLNPYLMEMTNLREFCA